MTRLVPVLLLAACGPSEPITWVEGWSYGWTGFNHRLSYLSYGIDGSEASVAVIGGTSTTDVEPVLPDTCDPEACEEFPFTDTSDVEVRWVRVQPTGSERGGTARVDLVADADGDSTTAVVDLPRKASGDAFAAIGGFTIDTAMEVSSGPSCYDPRYGWMPRRIAIALGAPTLSDDGRAIEVEVTARFEAGLSLEAERACIDAIAAAAQVPVNVIVVGLAGPSIATDSQDVQASGTYTWGCDGEPGPCLEPDPQPLPDLAERPLDLDLGAAAAGWGSFDFQFHGAESERGAYLRTLSVMFDGEEEWASGHATNYSPVTQLSAFDYAFTGEIRSVTLAEQPERGEILATLAAEVDGDGNPSPHRLPL